MSTTIGCIPCGALLFRSDADIARTWPPVCPKCGNSSRWQAWAGKPEWEAQRRAEWAAAKDEVTP
jgi:hypothetical protein